jgi:hypothetical protein
LASINQNAITNTNRQVIMTKLVKIEYRTFIPSAAVAGGIPGVTRFFNGGNKGVLNCVVDLDGAGATSLSISLAEWHETIEYATGSTEQVAGKPDWFHKVKASPTIVDRKTLVRTASNLDARWSVPSGATHGVLLFKEGTNPLVLPSAPAFTPAINAEIVIGLRLNGSVIEYMIKGSFDGFPAHEIKLNGNTVWSHDPISSGDDPLSLFPPMDESVALSWKSL